MDADQLYQLPPEEFIAARDAAAKARKAAGDAAGATSLAVLRKPSVAAWLVNRLAAQQGELLDQLLALGPALAEAQSRGRADDLRALGRQRRQLVEAITDTAASAAGRQVTAAVRAEVAATLEAALADQASAAAVRSRRLVRALSYAGLGTVDLTGAVAARSGPTSPAGAMDAAPDAEQPESGEVESERLEEGRLEEERLEAIRTAELAAHRAAGRLDDAVRRSETLARRLSTASSALAAAEAAVVKARAALEAAEQERGAARAVHARAEQENDEALHAVGAAQDEAAAARGTLDRLRRG